MEPEENRGRDPKGVQRAEKSEDSKKENFSQEKKVSKILRFSITKSSMLYNLLTLVWAKCIFVSASLYVIAHLHSWERTDADIHHSNLYYGIS